MGVPTTMIVPCGAEKLDRTAPAAELYQGSMFRIALDAAKAEAGEDGRVLILSALHGLLELDTLVAPYDVKMGDERSVDAYDLAEQLLVTDILTEDDDVYAMLPKAYLAVLDEAMRMVGFIPPAPVYEACGGIGEQRKVCRIVRDTDELVAA